MQKDGKVFDDFIFDFVGTLYAEREDELRLLTKKQYKEWLDCALSLADIMHTMIYGTDYQVEVGDIKQSLIESWQCYFYIESLTKSITDLELIVESHCFEKVITRDEVYNIMIDMKSLAMIQLMRDRVLARSQIVDEIDNCSKKDFLKERIEFYRVKYKGQELPQPSKSISTTRLDNESAKLLFGNNFIDEAIKACSMTLI